MKKLLRKILEYYAMRVTQLNHGNKKWKDDKMFFHYQKQPPQLFLKKGVLKNFANFTRKHLFWRTFDLHKYVSYVQKNCQRT